MNGGCGADGDGAGNVVDSRTPDVARMFDYYLLRHEALRYRVGVRDPRRWAVAAA